MTKLGTIRVGELIPTAGPITHALKIELWAGVKIVLLTKCVGTSFAEIM